GELGLAAEGEWARAGSWGPAPPVIWAAGSPWRVAPRCFASSASVREDMGWIVFQMVRRIERWTIWVRLPFLSVAKDGDWNPITASPVVGSGPVVWLPPPP